MYNPCCCCCFVFSEQPFHGNYSTLDSHTNTVIFLPVCLLVKMASKTVTRSVRRTLYWHVFHIYRSITHEEAINYLSYHKGKIKLIPELVLTSSKFILVSRLLFCNHLDPMGRHLDSYTRMEEGSLLTDWEETIYRQWKWIWEVCISELLGKF